MLKLLFIILSINSADAANTPSSAVKPVITESPRLNPYFYPIWSNLPTMPVAARFVAGAYLNGKYYQFCGLTSSSPVFYNRAQIWDGASWSVSSLTAPGGGMYGVSAAVWNNKIIISGGFTDYSCTGYNHTSVYDPIGYWASSTAMGHPNCAETAMAEVGGKCYLFGGYTSSGVLNEVWSWTPGDGAMAVRAAMPAARADLAAAVWNGKVYVFGGSSNTQVATNSIWEYTPASNTWVQKALLILPRRNATAVTLGNQIFVIGGQSTLNYTDTVEIYDPISDTVEFGLSLAYPRGQHASAGYVVGGNSASSGVIFVSGGYWSSTVLNTAERGDVSNIGNLRVQPMSLGTVKALFR